MKVLMPYIKRYRKDVYIALISVIALVFATLWQPRLLQVIMNAILKGDKAVIFQQGIVLILLAIVGIIAGVINTIYSARVALGVATDLRADLYKKVQTFAYADVEKFSASNLVVRMTNDINQVQQIVMAGFQQVSRIPLLFIGAFILAMVTMPQQWWVLIGLVTVFLLALVASSQNVAAATKTNIGDVKTIAMAADETSDNNKIRVYQLTDQRLYPTNRTMNVVCKDRITHWYAQKVQINGKYWWQVGENQYFEPDRVAVINTQAMQEHGLTVDNYLNYNGTHGVSMINE